MAERQSETKENDSNIKTSQTGDSSGGLTSPEGILLLCVAGLLDVIGFGLFLFSWLAIDDYGILDIIGTVIIGGWMLLRTGSTAGIEKVAKKSGKRFAIAFGIELVAFLGGACPSWTILVWKELKR